MDDTYCPAQGGHIAHSRDFWGKGGKQPHQLPKGFLDFGMGYLGKKGMLSVESFPLRLFPTPAEKGEEFRAKPEDQKLFK